jgi:hypothetical protein
MEGLIFIGKDKDKFFGGGRTIFSALDRILMMDVRHRERLHRSRARRSRENDIIYVLCRVQNSICIAAGEGFGH